MEGDHSERLLFRMQHIIPRLMSTAGQSESTKSVSADGPVEMTYPMTYGKIAGRGNFHVCGLIFGSACHLIVCRLKTSQSLGSARWPAGVCDSRVVG